MSALLRYQDFFLKLTFQNVYNFQVYYCCFFYCRLPYLSKFIAQKIALQVRSFREFQELHLEERLQLLRGLLVCRRAML
ncbi:hypothetical protein YC2023_081121 [Brassica napus]